MVRAGLAAVGLLAVTAAGKRQPGTGANNRRAVLKAAGHLDIPAALGTPEPMALAPDSSKVNPLAL